MRNGRVTLGTPKIVDLHAIKIDAEGILKQPWRVKKSINIYKTIRRRHTARFRGHCAQSFLFAYELMAIRVQAILKVFICKIKHSQILIKLIIAEIVPMTNLSSGIYQQRF